MSAGINPIDPASIPQRRLATGATMPAIGLGTFGSDSVSAADVAAAVRGAAEIGYRHFDCASVYGNEAAVGASLEAIVRSGVAREELWITSKVWNDKHAPNDVIASCQKSLADLRLDYLDLFLVHWPFPNFHPPGCDVSARSPDAKPYIHEHFMRTWAAMERLVDLGLVRHIGTSNMTVPKLELVLRDARIRPAANEMELHPHFQQPDLFRFVVDNGIAADRLLPARLAGPPGARPHARGHLAARGSRHRRHRRALTASIRPRCASNGRSQRGQTPIPFSVNPTQLRRQSPRRRRRPAERGRDARNRRRRPQLPAHQGAGLPLEGRTELGRPLGPRRSDHAALTGRMTSRSSQRLGPRRRSRRRIRSTAPEGDNHEDHGQGRHRHRRGARHRQGDRGALRQGRRQGRHRGYQRAGREVGRVRARAERPRPQARHHPTGLRSTRPSPRPSRISAGSTFSSTTPACSTSRPSSRSPAKATIASMRSTSRACCSCCRRRRGR